MRSKAVLILLFCAALSFGQVPNTATFSQWDITNTIYGDHNAGRILSGCFTDANSAYFDPAYNNDSYAPARSMLRFRNYHVVSTQQTCLAIGDSYGGGKVFYILQSGDLGYEAGKCKVLISAPSDQSNNMVWAFQHVYGTNPWEIGYGNSNTNAIISQQTSTGYYAAKICADLVIGEYSDWYLPSRNELTKLWLQRSIIGGFNGNAYWSSTTYGGADAFAIVWGSGYWTGAGMGTGASVRAIRSATYTVPTTYYSAELCDTFTKNNCQTGYHGGTYETCLPDSNYTSMISQEDADAQAHFDMYEYDMGNGIYGVGQYRANYLASCIPDADPIYYSAELCDNFTKNNCSTGYHGITDLVCLEAGYYSSTVSQAYVDQRAHDYMYSHDFGSGVIGFGQYWINYRNTSGDCIADVCTRPTGLTAANFIYYLSSTSTYINYYNACDPSQLVQSQNGAQGYQGFVSSFAEGTTVYRGTGTNCDVVPDGYYVVWGTFCVDCTPGWFGFQVIGGKIYYVYC